MSNKRASKRRAKRLARVPHHVVVQRQRNRVSVQRRAAKLVELAAAEASPEIVAVA